MSVRRLADEAVQPASFAFTSDNASWAEATIRKYPEGRQQSAVIPLLMRAQEQDGWVTRAAIETVAHMLDMPLIRVLEVATFYTQFQLAPVGTRAHIQVCGTTPCALRGAGELIDLCKRRIHSEPLHTNEAGTLSWEEVECQGACVNAPMVMIFKDTYEDLSQERLDEIIDAFEAGKGDMITPGPQIDRLTSAPASGLTSLTDEAAISKPNGAKRKAKAGGDEVPPSKAGRPRTDSRKTDQAIRSPSAVKVDSNGEKAESVSPPQENAASADRVSVEAEVSRKTRSHSGKKPSPEQAERAPALKRQKAPENPERGPESPSDATKSPPSIDKENNPTGRKGRKRGED
jgi:NADH-quinone oxidoreductase subunit E